MNETQPINLFTLTPGRVHVMGICGVGAAGIAWMLHLRGWKVSGCDQHIPPTMSKFFARNGIEVLQGHDAAHLAECDAVVYSAAIHADEPELVLARQGGKIVQSRGECLAGWVSGLRSIAVCGTHGKTTASCFATRLLQCIGQKPLWCLGGFTPRLLTNAGPRQGELAGRLPPNQIAVAEADESDGTLAHEHPAITVITNIDIDHLDHFQNAEEIEQCFAKAIENTREGVAVCADAPRAMRVAATFKNGPIITYGIGKDAMLRATEIKRTAEASIFTLTYNNRRIREIRLPIPGDHNILNALGAMAGCLLLGFDVDELSNELPHACAELPRRRFQWMTSRDASVRVVMDYAHHPSELLAMLSIARLQPQGRLRLVFQPHRYSRTQKLLPDFVDALSTVEEVILLPVYAASEVPEAGCDSYELYAAMRAKNPSQKLTLARSVEEVTAYLRKSAKAGDFILVAGAGDVERIAHQLGEAPITTFQTNPAHETLQRLLPDDVELRMNEPLAKHSFYRVGGEADVFAVPRDVPALSALCTVCKVYQIPLHVIGMGSNSWFSDLGLTGVLCSLQGEAFCGYHREGNNVTVGAGMTGAELLAKLEAEGLSGLEFLQGVPGTVGGWVRMNAGAHGHAIWEIVDNVRTVLSDGQIRHIPHAAFTAGYRSVRGLTGMILIAVTFTLTPATPEAIRAARTEAAQKRVQLAGLKTCGSLFKNPVGMKAGAVLDQLGAKQWSVGGAHVTQQHANIISADDTCTASDLLALMLKLKDALKRASGVLPHPEVQGFE